MTVVRHRKFKKNYKLRVQPDPKLRSKFQERLSKFLSDSKLDELKDHKLTGNLEGFRAFSVTGDIRVVYRLLGEDIELYDIGSHNQVY